MNEIQIFQNQEFGAIRTMSNEQGEPMFCLKDVCDVLELRTQKVVQRLEDDVLSKYPIFAPSTVTQSEAKSLESTKQDELVDASEILRRDAPLDDKGRIDRLKELCETLCTLW